MKEVQPNNIISPKKTSYVEPLIHSVTRRTKEKKSGYAFALVLLVLFLGITAGWGWHYLASAEAFLLDNSFIHGDNKAVQHPVAAATMPAILASPTVLAGRAENAQAVTKKQSKQHKHTTARQPLAVNGHNFADSQNFRIATHVDLGSRLIIPAIGLDAGIETIGILPNGHLDVPARHRWNGVGWFHGGAYPGERGSAVLDGHMSRPGGFPAVFYNLHLLHQGDEVIVRNADGHEVHFRVVSMQYYSYADMLDGSFFWNNSGTYLNIITCAGPWVPSIQQQSERLIVRTVLDGSA